MFDTAFKDVQFVLIMGFVFIIWAMLPHLHPPAEEDFTEPPGNVAAFIEWPPGNTDVDLWVDGPGEIKPVGYSNKSGVLWNLLRDDLGTSGDVTPSNHETSYTRGIVAGEYIINVHCYSCPSIPVRVDLEVSVKKEDKLATQVVGQGKPQGIQIIIVTHVMLRFNKDERTMVRFKLTEDGELVPDSMNSVYHKIKGKGQSNHLGDDPGDYHDE